MLIESISGVRGIVPTDINNDLVSAYASAFHLLLPEGSVILGRDTRPSGFELISSLTEQLISKGRDVLDCGICTTPTLQFVVEDTDAVGGIMVTASHNPSKWNGLKFVAKDGCFLNAQQFADLLSHLESDEDGKPEFKGVYNGFEQAERRHVDRVLHIDFIKVDTIRERQFRIAVDTVNGAASDALPYLLKKLGCEVIPVHCDPQGGFPRGTEPLPENLEDLCNAVREHECDLGFATDPDGDRLAVVDERGDPLGEEYTLVLATDDFLSRGELPETIVTNLSTTLAVEEVAKLHGGHVERTAVGEINVVERMKASGARLGGEGNGGVILKDVHLGRDSLVGAAMILNRLAKEENPLSSIYASLPQFTIVKDKVDISGLDSDELLSTIAEQFPEAEKNMDDGLKLIWSGRWIHVRKSNTEPIVRIYAEASTIGEAESLVDSVRKLDILRDR